MSEFKISRLKYTWRGVWGSGTNYIKDDVVSFGSKVYVCIAQHTADTDFYDDLNFLNDEIPPSPAPRWELMADGISWLGDWQTDTYYKVGDLIKKSGITYVCAVAHTSVSTETSFSSDLANWLPYVHTDSWQIAWQESTYYNKGDIVRYSGNVYRCVTPHVSASVISDGLVDDLSKWEVMVLSEYWRGDWTVDTLYFVNDIVKYGGTVYRCNGQHTSSNTLDDGLEDSTSVNWVSIYEGIEYVGEWSQAEKYRKNDLVKYGSYLYKCVISHTTPSGGLFDINNWIIYCPGFEFDTIWNDSIVYQPGDVVRYGGYLYKAIDTNLNSEPSTGTTDWEILFYNTRIRGEWSRNVEYLTGDVVRRQGQVYIAKQDVLGNDTDIVGDGSTIDSDNWDLLIAGEKWQNQWASSRTYVIGDVVLWRSGAYKCIGKHTSFTGNRPDNDGGEFWQKLTYTDENNVLSFFGDIKTFGIREDGSTIGTTSLSIGYTGQALQVNSTAEPEWKNFNASDKVYYVATNGFDSENTGTTQNSPWRTLRYALDNITGPATVFVKNGTYEEILPLRVPAFVAVVGDELRGTVIKPVNTYFTEADMVIYNLSIDYITTIIGYIILEEEVGTLDELSPAFGTAKYSEISQDFSGSPGTATESSSVLAKLASLKAITTGGPLSAVSGTNTASVNANILNAYDQIVNNLAFIVAEVRGYIENFNPTYTFLPSYDADIARVVNALAYDLKYPGNYKVQEVGTYFRNGSTYSSNKLSNMFLMRDGTGLRNCTLVGLEGTLGGLNQALTRRPTAGAFVSLDPGWGPSDSTAWVGTKSPYVQNVTNFGTGCVGFKIDGDLHSGGNQTMVANDFTQILSDGIGVWCNGTGRTEVVSVFTYYNHVGYLSTSGGKIRGTNGNCSYGDIGASAEGYDLTESPITGTVNNRYYGATVYQTLAINNGIGKLFYSHAGNDYTTATYSVTGAGINASLEGTEFRDGAVYEVRIKDPGDSSNLGGGGYLYTQNNAQAGGDAISLIIAASDDEAPATYRGMRALINSGTGTGQYGYVAEYDDVTKTAWIGDEFTISKVITASNSTVGPDSNVLTCSSTADLTLNEPIIFTGTTFGNVQNNTVYYVKEIVSSTRFKISDTSGGAVYGLINATGTMTLHHLGWNHLIPGTTLESIFDTTTLYSIEPRVTFSDPGFNSAAITLPSSEQWFGVTYGNGVFVAIADGNGSGSNKFAYSTNGTAWTATTVSNKIWKKVAYGNGKFIAVASDGTMISSANGATWSAVVAAPVITYSSLTYGNGYWVAVASGGTASAYSADGVTWTSSTLPEGADWNDIVYGKGKFVAVAQSDSSTTNTAYSTNNGQTWTLGSFAGGCKSVAYGNGRFVAIEGDYAGANNVFVSFDGITWTAKTIQTANWQSIKYAQGLFVAVADNSNVFATSLDGHRWTYETLSATGRWRDVGFGNPSDTGKFILVAGNTPNTVGNLVTTGVRTQGRAHIASGRISLISIWEPGSGYSSSPAMVLTDPNNTTDLTYDARIGVGVLGNPSVVTAGDGWVTTSTIITVTGDGYRDQYQTGRNLVLSNLTRIPSPGDNLNITGINDYTYKVLDTEILAGSIGNFTASISIAKTLGQEESPDQDTVVTIRQLYSQVRLTGHDFLDIGLGNFEETNYPNTLFPVGTILAPEDEIREAGGGRCFYTSTDQDGNFRVGELFSVEQATGTVTISADFFVLEGLEELQLGGVSVGGSGVVVREFSTDTLFIADSNNIIPTQKAIKAYLARRVSGGGADAFTAQLVAGVVRVGPNQINTTTGDPIIIPVKVNFLQPVDGDMLVQSFFLSGHGFTEEI